MQTSQKLYIYFDTSSGQANATSYNVWAHNTDPLDPRKKVMNESVWYLLEEMDFVFPAGFNPLTLRIEGLEAALQKEIADSHVKQERFKEEIGRLKCLTHDAECHFSNNEEMGKPPMRSPDIEVFDDDIPF